MTIAPARVPIRAGRLPLRARAAGSDALLPGLLVIALWLLWAVHNGGFDADTWYWGALLTLATLVVVAVLARGEARRLSGAVKLALAAFAGYVAWSYLSIAWAQAPGTALQGSNRALLYLIIFALMAVIRWRPKSALIALCVFALGIGAIALVLVSRFAAADQVGTLLSQGRLQAPTGYFNADAALFTIGALISTVLASRPELPALVRGLLVGGASASLQLAVVAQSRGWLFTLPLILVITVVIVPGRLRVVATALLPTIAAVIPVHKLLAVFSAGSSHDLAVVARSAGRESLVLCTVMIVVATLLAWAERLAPAPQLTTRVRRGLGLGVTLAVLIAGVTGAVAATHGDPVGFVKRQWNGFSHPTLQDAHGSYFATIGSGRYDFWRVSLDAFSAHPVGGLGQDNFEDYYLPRRHTREEPLWTHSLELRLLASTGLVGFLLFSVFLGGAITAAVRARRRGPPIAQMAAAAAVLPATVWLVHGSVDWFWEIPALTGPALGFLAMAGALAREPSSEGAPEAAPPPRPRRAARVVVTAAAVVGLIAVTVVLTLPYLSVREVSMASDIGASDPAAALHDLQLAADLNPLNSDAGTRAGLLALSEAQNLVARQRFAQAIDREPGSWLPWLGTGLADSALGERASAARALRHAYSINNRQPPIKVGLQRVFSARPLTYAEAVPLFEIAR